MNELNKELLERALAEGVDESCWGYTSLSFSLNGIFTGFHTTKQSTESSLWQYVCTKEEYLAVKAEKESRKTASEYDIGCYYEFSDYEDYEDLCIGILASVGRYGGNKYPFECKGDESYRYIRPLTAKAGEIKKPKPLSGFVNIYSVYNFECTIFKTRDLANLDQYVSARVACIDLSQFNEGEGL